jgi:hypothetical protein
MNTLLAADCLLLVHERADVSVMTNIRENTHCTAASLRALPLLLPLPVP